MGAGITGGLSINFSPNVLRSNRPKRPTRPFDASVDHTEARNRPSINLVIDRPIILPTGGSL